MKKVTFECETITPLFLGEAKKEMVELRPPAIKAAMRFWWRAMHADLSPGDMKKLEADIFGGGGNNAKSADFDIVLSEPNHVPVPYNYPHNPIEGINMGTTLGIQYLMYTFFYLKHKGNYFPPTTTFYVSFYFDNNNRHINQILASFWLLVFLGNIGERARRGFGSINVISNIDEDHLLGDFNFTTYNLEAIRAGLNMIKSSEGFVPPSETLTINNSFSHIFNKEIYFSNTRYRTWKDALDDIGSKMSNFRLNNTDITLADITSHHLFADKSAIFGLPIKHSNGSTVKPQDFNRRASPLIIKIIQVGLREFRWMLIRLEGDFLPTGHTALNIVGTANNSVLTTFLNPTTLNMTII